MYIYIQAINTMLTHIHLGILAPSRNTLLNVITENILKIKA